MRNLLVKLFGYSFLAATTYMALCIMFFVYSMVCLSKGIVLSNSVLNAYQTLLYFGNFTGTRNVWQADPKCVDFDEDLFYKPKIGECRFENYEFSTQLHFDDQGRVGNHDVNKDKPGIAVIGDSHAMGWGVADDQTFSWQLEKKLGRPVYNLGVSSYGTYREMLRLQKSGLLDKVDTIIIQYSDNDIDENIVKTSSEKELDEMRARSAFEAKASNGGVGISGNSPKSTEARFKAMHEVLTTTKDLSFLYGKLKLWVTQALAIPVRVVKSSVLPRSRFYDFTPHMEALDRVFMKFPWIGTKRVIFFYLNSHQAYRNHRDRLGVRFSNYQEVSGRYDRFPIEFVDIYPGENGFFVLDEHMTLNGHLSVAERLASVLKK